MGGNFFQGVGRGMSGPLNSLKWLSQQQVHAMMNAQHGVRSLTLDELGVLRGSAPTIPPRVELANGGIGLLPKDLMAELVQADSIPERITAAVQAYQSSRETKMQQSQQLAWSNGFTQTAQMIPQRFLGQSF